MCDSVIQAMVQSSRVLRQPSKPITGSVGVPPVIARQIILRMQVSPHSPIERLHCINNYIPLAVVVPKSVTCQQHLELNYRHELDSRASLAKKRPMTPSVAPFQL
ncbi:hypothetical protein J6590_080655 [Homalodisca vitripennis]|nr:hypothetical protein J6590_080655 [Homalodisca vitripennis]